MTWLSDLDRLQHLESDLALLPVGWGNEGKAPMFYGKDHETTPEDWTKKALTVEQLKAWPRRPFHSVGLRTGLLTGPIVVFDFDGTSSVDYGAVQDMEPWGFHTWQVHRDNDPNRLKVLARPTPDQIAQLPEVEYLTKGCHVSHEFQNSKNTKNKEGTNKGEALEVFFAGGRQAIVLGEHPSSGGNYFWPEGLGPEALSAPPAAWWDFAIQMAQKSLEEATTGSKPSTTRNGTRKLNPCPICGRHNGKGGSSLWCDVTSAGLILCMPGATFSAEQTHGSLTIGQVVNGYALVKRTADVLTFKPHEERSSTPSPRTRRIERTQQLARLVAAF